MIAVETKTKGTWWLGDVLGRFIGDPTAFAIRVADKRNLLTHPKPAGEDESDPQDLWLATEQLSLLTWICLLHELGFAKDKLDEMIERNEAAKFIVANKCERVLPNE